MTTKRSNSKKSPPSYKKRIVVTGGAGFIGSHYLNKFVVAYPDTLFINIDSLTYAANIDNIKIDKEINYIFEKADIRNISNLRKIFKKYQPTDIIHFAAESHVDLSIKNPSLFIETNVMGTHNLLILAREFKTKRFLFISTDEVYGALATKKGVFTEDSPLMPRNPYSASKAAADRLVHSYHHTFGLDIIITRSSNNYGPHQDKSKLIPLFTTNLSRGKKVPLYGEGAQIRDWLFVEDNIRAIDLVFQSGKSGEVYNIAGNTELSNLELTKKLLAFHKLDNSYIMYVPDRPGHDFRYSLDCTKIKVELGWKPAVSFDEGLLITLSFYKNK